MIRVALRIVLLVLVIFIDICVSKDSAVVVNQSWQTSQTSQPVKTSHIPLRDDQVYQSTFTKAHKQLLKNKTKQLFNHAWNSYLDHGFPYDEVKPLTCEANMPDYNDFENTVKNDVLGNYSLTVFDNLDTFIIMNEPEIFHKLIYWAKEAYPNFEINSNVQIFETNIRILGGLLSAHLYASDERKNFAIAGYDGFLLKLAYDLGERLILAFNTPTGIPFPRTNLAKGPLATPKSIQMETCTAGAASPVLELTLLSKLTGDPKFEKISKKAFYTIWNSRTELDLLPMTIDFEHGKWLDSFTGIGASVDSFYEYALKSAILFDDDEMLKVWEYGYKAVNTHLRNDWMYNNVDATTGFIATSWIDSLSAFWPGLQVLAGDVENAVHYHLVYLKLWETYRSIPERWNFMDADELLRNNAKKIEKLSSLEKQQLLFKNSIALEWYPLRPEFIESTYHLYRATRDPIYLQIGQDILYKLDKVFRAPCGFAGVVDVLTDKRQNKMESFVLSETLKYLYLLFDEENQVHQNNVSNLIFSTEGHPLWFDKKLLPEITKFDWFSQNNDTNFKSLTHANNANTPPIAKYTPNRFPLGEIFDKANDFKQTVLSYFYENNNNVDFNTLSPESKRLLIQQTKEDLTEKFTIDKKQQIKQKFAINFFSKNIDKLLSAIKEKIENSEKNGDILKTGEGINPKDILNENAEAQFREAIISNHPEDMFDNVLNSEYMSELLDKIELEDDELLHDDYINSVFNSNPRFRQEVIAMVDKELADKKLIPENEIRRKDFEKINSMDLNRGPATIMTNLEDYKLEQSLDYLNLQTCILPLAYRNKGQEISKSFVNSALLLSPELYHIDERYRNSLIKPLYLNGNKHDELAILNNSTRFFKEGANSIELSRFFYDLYTSHNNLQQLPQSSRVPTTETFEALFDPKDKIRYADVYKLIPADEFRYKDYLDQMFLDETTPYVLANDCFVGELNGLRAKFEKLSEGKIDSQNNYITGEYIRKVKYSQQPYDEQEEFELTTSGDSILRALKVNGKDINENEIVWISANDTRLQTGELKATSNGLLIISGDPVENMRVWFG